MLLNSNQCMCLFVAILLYICMLFCKQNIELQFLNIHKQIIIYTPEGKQRVPKRRLRFHELPFFFFWDLWFLEKYQMWLTLRNLPFLFYTLIFAYFRYTNFFYDLFLFSVDSSLLLFDKIFYKIVTFIDPNSLNMLTSFISW